MRRLLWLAPPAVLLIILVIVWTVIPLRSGSTDLIVIHAESAQAMTWFIVGGVLTVGTAFVAGWWLRAWTTRQRYRLLNLLRDHVDVATVVYSGNQRIRWANRAGQALLSEPNPDVLALVARAGRLGRSISQNILIRDGERFTVEAIPMQGAVCVIAQAMPSPQSEFYQRFLQRVVHDMRNPLAAIISHAGNLQSTPKEDVDLGVVQIIENEAMRLTRLVDSLLFDARLSYVPPALESLDLIDLIEEVMYQFDERAVSENKQITLEMPTGTAPFKGDHDLLARALSNLVDNSLKYSKAGAVVTLALQNEPGTYRLQVRDSGDGIPPDYLPDRLFEPLVRARKKDGGSGLGLAIVKKVADLHGGRVAAESTLGQGTTITLWLPC